MKWLYACLGALIMLGLTFNGMHLSYDSAVYLNAASYFNKGKVAMGLSTILPDHPPFYSLFLAGFHRFASVVCFAALVGLMYTLGREIGGIVSGHVAALLVLSFVPLVQIFTWVWSEVLFLPLSIATLFCLYRGLVHKHRTCFWLAAVFAALSLLTRFLGITVVFTGIVAVVLSCRLRVGRREILWILLASSPLLLYAFINRTIAPVNYSLLTQGWECVKVVYGDIGPFLLLPIAGAMILRRYRLWWPMALYVLIYLGTLIVVSSTIWIDPIDTRLLVPIYPILILYVSLFMQKVVSYMAVVGR